MNRLELLSSSDVFFQGISNSTFLMTIAGVLVLMAAISIYIAVYYYREFRINDHLLGNIEPVERIVYQPIIPSEGTLVDMINSSFPFAYQSSKKNDMVQIRLSGPAREAIIQSISESLIKQISARVQSNMEDPIIL